MKTAEQKKEGEKMVETLKWAVKELEDRGTPRLDVTRTHYREGKATRMGTFTVVPSEAEELYFKLGSWIEDINRRKKHGN